MPEVHQNGSFDSRLNRLEGLMAMLIEDHLKFSEEHKQLLTAQVVLTDRVDKLTITVDTAIRELKEAQKHTDERLNALITVVDGIIRNRPPQ